jgi:hypothetical protein
LREQLVDGDLAEERDCLEDQAQDDPGTDQDRHDRRGQQDGPDHALVATPRGRPLQGPVQPRVHRGVGHVVTP